MTDLTRTDYHVIPETHDGKDTYVIAHGENKLFRFMCKCRATDFCAHHNLAEKLHLIPAPHIHDYFDMEMDTIWSEPRFVHKHVVTELPIALPSYPKPKHCSRFIAA